MKVIQKSVFVAVGIFLAGILVTGMLSRYLESKTNQISENIEGIQEEVPEFSHVLPEPETHLEAAVSAEAENVPAEPLFTPQIPVSGDVLSGYTGDSLVYSALFKDYRAHPGIDLRGAVGEAVRAVDAGTVTQVFMDSNFGKMIMITHAEGFESVYGNLDEDVPVQPGDMVVQGETIGAVGDTAMAEQEKEPHLHFELYKDSKPVNPADYMEL